ncbi:MAG: glycine--tRNA ligase subunit beta [Rhodobacter sp.]|nr:glycine--tRNA ligase subunit beta [Rhodobacter sp.]MCY4241150.1 glycine--tRNA ligase subunit beta [Rhodobacter sp.]
MPDLLIELFSEEIPARLQERAAEDLRKLVTEGLVKAGLVYAHAGAFSTPRRLALVVEGVPHESPAVREERKGPRFGAPERAIEGFLKSTGLTMDQLDLRDDRKGQVWFAVTERTGRPAAEIIAEVLEAAVRTFPWPKSMRWGTGNLRWVRPLHSIVCILTDEAGSRVVPVRIDELTAGDTTEGHRFMGSGGFSVRSFEEYETRLKRGRVILRAGERADRIWTEARNLAFAHGMEVVEDRGLLAEVAGLVEWPVVLMGEIGAEFLTLPSEVLQTSMREHQKFFSVRNAASGRIERFLTVANIEAPDQGEAILSGNRKVLAARLSDAKFFWENDRRTVERVGMTGMAEPLATVTFHGRLGSMAARVGRIAALAREIAPFVSADPDMVDEAARIAKADLSSDMVREFPELQGIMGNYYARMAGHGDDAALACEEHHLPKGPSDKVPIRPVSVAVGLADRIDMLTGFWAIDEKPTGSRDSFGLRRAALGVIRLILVGDLRIPLGDVFRKAASNLGAVASTPDLEDLMSFLHDRLKVHLRDRGIRNDIIDSCLAMPGNDDLAVLARRAEALNAFIGSDNGANLLQGFRRANNILVQAESRDGRDYRSSPDPALAVDGTEHALFQALEAANPAIDNAMETEDFGTAMLHMASLRPPIDAFFETVQIDTDDAVLRSNRLRMLHRIRRICLSVADLTRIEG